MTSIIASQLDIEHWSSKNATGPLTMFKAMQAEEKSAQWIEREKSVGALVCWWTRAPSYDPDWEPENLISRIDLTPLSKEILGIAAVHRIRPQLLSWEIPDAKETQQFLTGSTAKAIRQALTMQNTGTWWNRCLFEGSDAKYYARTEHLVSALMSEHAFVHMANSLNMPLHELLPMMDCPSSPNSGDTDAPVLPDLC